MKLARAVAFLVCWLSPLSLSQAQMSACDGPDDGPTPAGVQLEPSSERQPADTMTETVSSQESPVEGGGNILFAFPRKAFKKIAGVAMPGLSGYIGVRPPRSPTMVGVEVGYMGYGLEDREEPFGPTIPDVRVDVSTQNSIVSMHLLSRLQPQRGRVRPYLEGLVGFNYFFTYTSVSRQNSALDEDDAIAGTINYDDVAFSYGWGGGLLLQVYDGTKKKGFTPAKDVRRALIDFRVRSLYGTEANYLKEGGIRRHVGHVTYDVNRSRTDMVVGSIGVVFEF
ncbi:MAG: hypothetical protein HY710_15940 [Candidatus Latescibacteria bacterium]|nr:hypothetical protein [Candidatus Latescibacterota bacterium]